MPRRQPGEVITGTATPEEIYLRVGVALSWWEGSEDVLMGLFDTLIGRRDRLAFDLYVSASRSQRQRLLKAAIEASGKRLLDDERAGLRDALGALDKLSTVRNEIAHGHCCSIDHTENGRLVMSGNFLLPSLNEGIRTLRTTYRYYHTAQTISDFTESVRLHRGQVMDVNTAIWVRHQEGRQALDDETRNLLDFVEQVASGNFPAEKVSKVIKRV